jgi:hypothetical protein
VEAQAMPTRRIQVLVFMDRTIGTQN